MTLRATKRLFIIMPAQNRGGVEAHGLVVGAAAQRLGWQVEVGFPKLPGTQRLADDFESASVRYQPLAIGETEVRAAATLSELIKTSPVRLRAWIEKPWQFIRVLVCLLRWRSRSPNVARAEVVLINLPWADKGFTSLLACALLNQPVAVVFHLIPWQLDFPRWKRWVYRWMRRRNQVWIGIAENNRQLISLSFNCPAKAIACIYNGVSLPERATVDCAKPRQRLRTELALSNDSFILLTVARLDAQKGHDYLIPAIPHLIRQFPKIRFVWVGSGEQQASLEAQLIDYGVRSSVSFLGYRQDISELLRAADLFVFPTYFEGFPFALLEAMAHGLPVVSASVNGIPEIIEHQTHGLLTRKGDSCDLLESLRWALDNPEAMQKMAERAALRVRDFSQEKMVAETLSLLEKMGE